MGGFFDTIRSMFDPADDFYWDDYDTLEVMDCVLPGERLEKKKILTADCGTETDEQEQ